MAGTRHLLTLQRRTRWREAAIHLVLLLASLVSILVTVGIVVELARGAWRFFTFPLWEETNRVLAASLPPEATLLQVSPGGRALPQGAVLRLGEEQVRVVAVEGPTRFRIQRGWQGTIPRAHLAGTAVYLQARVSLKEFLTHTRWIPQTGDFGILPLVTATFVVSGIAMAVALPLGLAMAIYLSEYASPRVRETLKPLLELLAGVPTVVYGYFALTFVTPVLRRVFGPDVVEIYNMASAGLVVGILVTPLVASMSEDALRAVPQSLREAAYALGATPLETTLHIVVPAAFSGLTAAFIVAISRAIGETMIVALAAGAGPNLTLNPFRAAETITGHIVRISGGDLSYNSIEYYSIFALGLVLFLLTLGLNILSQWVVTRFREEYS